MHKSILVLAVAAVVAGCASTNNKNYEAYLNTVRQVESTKAVAEEASRVAKSQEYASISASCTDSACTSNVAAFKAISDLAASLGGGNNRGVQIAAPQREPTLSEQLLGWAGIFVPGVTSYASIRETNKTQRHLSDNQASERISQNEMWGTIIGTQGTAWSTAVRDVTATPSIVVGGNYGNTETNTAGNNLISGNNNLVGDRNNNSGRQDSNGPFDNSGNCRNGDANCPVVTNGGE